MFRNCGGSSRLRVVDLSVWVQSNEASPTLPTWCLLSSYHNDHDDYDAGTQCHCTTKEEMMAGSLWVYLALTGNIGDVLLTTRPILYLSRTNVEGIAS
jgi:hypothetical protein